MNKMPSIILIHGFPFHHEMWNPQVDVLRREGFEVDTYDVRGHGQGPSDLAAFTLEQLVDDLFVHMDQRGIPSAILCGLSMGGYIALRAHERAPGRVRALILCDTRSEADSDEAKLKRHASIRTIRTQGLETFADGFLKSLVGASTMQHHPALVEQARRMMLSNRPEGVCSALVALASRTDTTASLPAIQVPTLLLFGEEDRLTPPTVGKALRDRILSARLEIIPGAGHLSNLENSEAFNRHLLDFLNSLNLKG